MALWSKVKKAWKKVKKAASKVVRTVLKVAKVAREIANRGFAIFDFIASLVGIQPKKHARLKVIVLLNEKSTPVKDRADVERWVNVTRDVLKERLNVDLHPWKDGEPFVEVQLHPAPATQLRGLKCKTSEGFTDRADWFEDHIRETVFGYDGEMYAFVVEEVEGNGCAWPWIHSFCVVDAGAKSTTLAHEMGHLCGLIFPNGGHSTAAHNLMNSERDDMDSNLTRWQVSVFRNARYITYWNVRGF